MPKPRGRKYLFAPGNNLPGYNMCICWLIVKVLHRLPKLATPLASNTLDSVWSSRISTKYRTLHYLHYLLSRASVQGEGQRCRWAAPAYPDCMGWTWPAYYDKAIKQWRTRLRAYSTSRPKVATSSTSTNFEDEFRMIVSMNVSHFVKICQVLMILHQLICRGVANWCW